MAAPASKTIKDLSGKWTLNKTLSDSPDDGLALQGIGFFTRKAIGLATITIEVTQKDAPPKPPATDTGLVTHIHLTQSASGLTSTEESRYLDDLPREHSDWLFGTVDSRSRWISLADVDDEFLAGRWVVEGEGKTFVLSQAVSRDNGWTATQVWGFQTVNGERRYCRNILIQKNGQRAAFRFVYDYLA